MYLAYRVVEILIQVDELILYFSNCVSFKLSLNNTTHLSYTYILVLVVFRNTHTYGMFENSSSRVYDYINL